MEKYYIIIAEGITDCTLLECIIEKQLQFRMVNTTDAVPEIWRKFIGSYPAMNGSLSRKITTPSFFKKDDINVAIKQANGYTNIPKELNFMIEEMIKEQNLDKLNGILIVMDTDTHLHSDRINDLKNRFDDYDMDLNIVDEIHIDRISIEGIEINSMVYFIPMEGQGAVERLILQCAQVLFPEAYNLAEQYKNQFMEERFNSFRQEYWCTEEEIQQFYGDKLQFGALAAAVKPDRPARFMISDNIVTRSTIERLREVTEYQLLCDYIREFLYSQTATIDSGTSNADN